MTDIHTYIRTQNEIRSWISCLALRRSATMGQTHGSSEVQMASTLIENYHSQPPILVDFPPFPCCSTQVQWIPFSNVFLSANDVKCRKGTWGKVESKNKSYVEILKEIRDWMDDVILPAAKDYEDKVRTLLNDTSLTLNYLRTPDATTHHQATSCRTNLEWGGGLQTPPPSHYHYSHQHYRLLCPKHHA